MLTNLTPIPQELERRAAISKEHGFPYTPQSDPSLIVETGIYRSACDFNFAEPEFEETQNLSFDDRYGFFPDIGGKSTYGVADSIEQIKEYYREEIADLKNKYAIAVTPVFQERENRGKGGGWRWHKWGPYIGKLEPQCEYLDDEDFGEGFKYILTFSIYRIK